MAATEEVAAQRLVVYKDEAGNAKVYTSAYGDDQVKDAIVACATRHGRTCGARSVDGKEYARENGLSPLVG
jgi:hypothetical protein